MCKALFASMQSAFASLLWRVLSKPVEGVTILLRERSNATVKAIAI
jgi:hypothetical protein